MRHKPKIFDTLVRNYIFFSLTVGVSVFFLLLYFVERTNQQMPDTETPQLKASEIVLQYDANIPSKTLEAFHGWLEILDENLQIVDVKGNKVDRTTSYSEKELNSLFYDVKDNPYYVSIAPFRTNGGKTWYGLVKIPKDNISMDFTVNDEKEEIWIVFWQSLSETGLLFALLFGINVYVYSRWTAVKITNPLNEITSGIRSIAGGRYHERLHFKASYELVQIQENFNLMAEKLENAEKEKLLLEESKQRMLVHISHDLKTPITTIQGYAKALQLGMIEEESKKQRTISLIHDKAQLVAELIDDVFELFKLDSSDYPLKTQAVDIAEFIREIAAEYYDQFEDKQFSFEYEIPSWEVIVLFNRKLLYRAISNLLSNALKYNPKETHVRVALIDESKEIRIEVVDNGIGIPDHWRDKVFDAFVRGDAARKSDGGTGLGLTIAKHIVEKHDGCLRLNTSDGTTRFEITLPKMGFDV
ncbi:HAMP domain-containing sensor histidine kinase [Risungbinella massiliensis]|uniref:HAMP domain-containing sensor histidine kinase n=1 Tax=Risungbinella massiliensis TaxID=1329796 RepID=UPI0005CC3A90|nr:HAMP domain-containing sensor histidine kinase [Risungbinella massiliensis]